VRDFGGVREVAMLSFRQATKRIEEMKLSEGLYWLLVIPPIIGVLLIFIFALVLSIYYSISTGRPARAFSVIFHDAFSGFFNETTWPYDLFWFSLIAVISVIKFRRYLKFLMRYF
jgi:ABC-type sugar transport system permease subunit